MSEVNYSRNGMKRRAMMKIIAITILMFACTACKTLFSEDIEAATVLPTTNVVEAISSEMYLQLKAENDALRRENQMLRCELVAKRKVLPDGLLPDRAVKSEPNINVPVEDTGYWLSDGSGIRHNRRCRNYRKVKGRPCGAKDGRPCKKCGG